MTIDTPYRLSIIIPSFNRQGLLEQLITTIDQQNQEVENSRVELIVVDDGSVKALKQPNQKITIPLKWIRLEKNMGAPYARKVGFQHSSGKYIHFHDSDDSILTGWLAATIKCIKVNPTLDFLIGARTLNSFGCENIVRQVYVKKFASKISKIRHRLQYNNCLGPLGGLTFSRRSVNKMRFGDLPSCQDWDMYLDALDFDTHIVVTEKSVFIKNDYCDGQISQSCRKKLRGFMMLGRKHKTINGKKSIVRLFSVHSVIHRFRDKTNIHLKKFLKKNKLKIYISFMIIELEKLRARLL